MPTTKKAMPRPKFQPPFETVFNHLQEAVGVSRETVHLFCNPAFAALFGFDDPQEIIGKPVLDVIAPSERPRIQEYIRLRAIDGEAPKIYETRGLRRDGSEFDMEVHPSKYEADGQTHTLVILRDVTMRKRTEAALRSSEELNRHIVQSVPGGIVMVALNGAILQANAEAQRILGLSFNAISQLYVNDFDLTTLHEDGSPFHASAYPVSRCLATGLAQPPVIIGCRRPDESLSWAIFSAIPMTDPATGKQTGALVTFVDITKRKKAEAALRESEERYRSALAAIHEAVIIFDSDGIMRACNPSCETLFGLNPDLMIGKSGVDPNWKSIRPDGSIFPVDEYPFVVTLRDARPLSNVVMGLYRLDGELIWLSMNSVPIQRPGEARPSAAVVSITDITQRTRAEAALRSSESRLEAIVAHTPNVAVEGYDINGRVLYWNAAAEKIFGYRADEAIGKTLDQLVMDDASKAQFVDTLIALDRSGQVQPPKEWSFKAKNGKSGSLYSTIFPIPARDGRKEFICMDIDISQLKTAEAELAHSLSLVQATLESTADGILAVGTDYVIKSWNRKFVEMWGLGTELLETRDGTKVLDLMLSQIANLDEFLNSMKVMKADSAHAAFFIIYLKDGRVFERFAHPQYLNGEIVGRVLSFRDVTARVRAEAERIALDRKLLETQKLESLGVLAGGIAHDFNNLLAAVLGNVSLAAMHIPPDSPVRPFLASIETTTHRAAELCKQMLAYSGKGRFVIQPVGINALIREMADLLKISISKNIALNFDLPPNLPRISADATQLRQVLMNLIINASEAIGTENSGVISLRSGICRIEYAALREAYLAPDLIEGDYLFLEVADTGCGMDAATKTRIFDPFFTTKFTGRGLGLAAVLGIVRGHKGAIKVESTPGNGTSFRILLPFEQQSLSTRTPSEILPKLSGHILIVEDDETLRTLQARMISTLGLSSTPAGNGPQAIAAFRARPRDFTAVLLDLSMPGMNGEEVFEELLQMRPDLPVILMSGFEDAQVIAHCSAKGKVRFLQKPFTPADLSRELTDLLK